MKKLLALAVVATALFAGSAKAAAVDIFVTNTVGNTWEITVTTDGTNLGGIALLGNTLMTNLVVNSANAAISALDSGLVEDVLGDGTTNAMSINNTGTGVVITSGSTPALLGTLSIPGGPGNPGNVRAGDELYGYTALDASGGIVADVVVHVPEPTALLLLGFGLAGVALVRRQA